MLQAVVGEAWPLDLQLADGDTGKFPQAVIYAAGAAIATATVDLAHLTSGRYYNTHTFAAGNWTVQYLVYADALHTTLDVTYDIVADEVVAQVNDLDSLPASFLSAMVSVGYSVAQFFRIIAAAVAGKASGGPGSPVFRDIDDTRDVITGTADSSGNRTAATYDPGP